MPTEAPTPTLPPAPSPLASVCAAEACAAWIVTPPLAFSVSDGRLPAPSAAVLWWLTMASATPAPTPTPSPLPEAPAPAPFFAVVLTLCAPTAWISTLATVPDITAPADTVASVVVLTTFSATEAPTPTLPPEPPSPTGSA